MLHAFCTFRHKVSKSHDWLRSGFDDEVQAGPHLGTEGEAIRSCVHAASLPGESFTRDPRPREALPLEGGGSLPRYDRSHAGDWDLAGPEEHKVR